jgi:hypothetical protein
MARRSFDDGSHPATRLVVGVFITFVSSVALIGLLHGGGTVGLDPRTTAPSGLFWGLVALLGSCLGLGAVWTVWGIRGTFLPTSLLYRLTDLPGLLERLTGTR